MADKVLRWYIDGQIGIAKTEVGGIYHLGCDYRPTEVLLHARIAGTGNTGTKIDIMCDGVSIFKYKPVLLPNDTDKRWSTVDQDTMREGSVLRLDILEPGSSSPCRDLTVELYLDEV